MIKQIKSFLLPFMLILFGIFGINEASLSAGYDMGYGDQQLYASAPIYGGHKNAGFNEGTFLTIFWSVLSVIIMVLFIIYCITGCFACLSWWGSSGFAFFAPVRNCYSGKRRHHDRCGHGLRKRDDCGICSK